MTSTHPDILVRPTDEAGLVWTTLISGGLHIAAAVLVFSVSPGLLRPLPPVESYTVDLVSSNEVAGTNLVAGPGARAARPALPAPPVVDANASAPPQAAPVEPEAPQAKPAPPEPPKPDLADARVEAPVPPKPVAAAPPEIPPVPEKPKEAAATVKKVSEPPKPPVKPADRKPARAPESKPAAATAQEKSVSSSAAPSAAQEEARKRDQTIAMAVERRAQAARGGTAGGTAGGTGSGGGPLSIGSGDAAGGGIVRGVEYLLYRNLLTQRIKQNWVWPGSGKSLEAVVRFEMTPEGDVINVRTVRSSGDPTFDASVERAVRAASPIGPPPEQYRGEFVNGVEITFRPEDLRS